MYATAAACCCVDPSISPTAAATSGGMNIGVAIPNPGTGRAKRCTTSATIAVPSSAGPSTPGRCASMYSEISIGMIAPPTLIATCVEPSQRSGTR